MCSRYEISQEEIDFCSKLNESKAALNASLKQRRVTLADSSAIADLCHANGWDESALTAQIASSIVADEELLKKLIPLTTISDTSK